eukprot:2373788-Rhodomonas_salina.1
MAHALKHVEIMAGPSREVLWPDVHLAQPPHRHLQRAAAPRQCSADRQHGHDVAHVILDAHTTIAARYRHPRTTPHMRG